jgi:lipid-A-disaccharide synthase
MMVAGEVSGDMHAAGVIRELLSRDKKMRIFGMGGPQMARAGMKVREDLTRQALIGFWEVLRHYPLIKRRFRQCEQWLREEKPDLLFLVDYPGFNLRLAQKAQALGVPVCYYVAPKVWAWNKSRLAVMKKVIQKLLVIFPFEKEYFRKEGIPSVYVGNPLMEEMNSKSGSREKVCQKNGIEGFRFPLISAMPGSRQGEIARIWPVYLEASRLLRKSYPDAGFIVPQPAGLTYESYTGLRPDDPFFFVQAPAYDLRRVCDLAWVKSGTGTLETALLKTPMVVCYKIARLSGFLAKKFLKIKYVSLVNILAGHGLVRELLQEKANPRILAEETARLLENVKAMKDQVRGFEKIRKSLAHPTKTSKNVAKEILELLADKK